ncbi:hypothetical protein BDP81DRAFT_7170 [Colletotrichum phormii]|uniref:Uncharacterized protein n=1 Tax=Colletotrichum phormii TaxID=359342 RepID=A0AAJ0A496_9PEZI|nr:uncharacterized protein BDP81DRAFT_7170 [Colletotrichum phormii]KAK1655628.1 hypothetical protein BDP81DRAFT_7170 [Colletotrichum phormii]
MATKAFFTVERLDRGWFGCRTLSGASSVAKVLLCSPTTPSSVSILIPGQRKQADESTYHVLRERSYGYIENNSSLRDSQELSHEHLASNPDTDSHFQQTRAHPRPAGSYDLDQIIKATRQKIWELNKFKVQIMTRHSTRGGSREPDAESHDEICLKVEDSGCIYL